MTAPLNVDPTMQATATGYSARPPTKPPNWHGLVTLDLLFNNLSTGLFLVTALGELVAPASFRPLATVAYPIALLFLIGDLVCLVLDLGDPFRFHHMLRVWKPSSPMSLGTWCLTAYAVPLAALTLMGLLPGGAGLEWARRPLLVAGLVFGVGAAVYKGVLFSTTAQRGWSDARWLGGYLINSALALGAAELLVLGTITRQPEVAIALRLALRLLLLLNLLALGLLLVDLRGPLSAARGPRTLAVVGALAVAGGVLVPLWLLALDGPLYSAAALFFMLLGAVVGRSEVVRLPHLLAEANPGLAQGHP
jgi:Ni/Fe-hydrogenase subunit HybB-like protein